MTSQTPLRREFYNRPTLMVARDLLGKRLYRLLDGKQLSGTIIEAEAYIGEEDLACHARAGKTKRTAVMYGPPGHTYVYFTYGMHWMLNVVTEAEDHPAAVLIRAIAPIDGEDVIATRRQGRDVGGPAKLTQALGIDGSVNGVDLCSRLSGLWIGQGVPVAEDDIITGPRVGLFSVPEPWKSKPWRFRLSSAGNPVSGVAPGR